MNLPINNITSPTLQFEQESQLKVLNTTPNDSTHLVTVKINSRTEEVKTE